ncbi:RNA-directed DNA polymerase, eukaryota [Tanacetum coccineum]|uniref:RNA-directed DNA polymerase, eukaryota n=1 Tax=Tanacetum coccineum TaxID=301880 RepID=A0ABQ5E0A5_9ASTR
MEDICVRHCWGNSIFDHAYSDSVGSSRGILCIWDPNSFNKHSVTVSDYFVIIRGTWRTSRQKVLMIVVYGPHDCRDKQSLWEFLHHEISKWRGEVIIMGDFNKVHLTSDRFGSNFNELGAHMFNSFIADSGLVEVPLGGCHFTWCLKSAKKMSKLDRFLVSENLLVSCPHLTAVTLERYLSDHRPILLRENHYDYGPTPFRFFHHWIQTDGFDKIVSESWKNSPSGGTNAMKSLMYKLKHLKYDIREWNKHNMVSRKNMKTQYKKNLEAVDQILDSGQGVEEDIRVRSEIIRKLQNCDEIDSMELWMVYGVESKKSVKREFLDHFSKRFCKPDDMRATLTMEFPNRLHPDQSRDLEMSVSNEEIKKAVWECGTDKAPGCNSSFIALIPKIPDANLVKDFRPISLIGSLVVDAGLFHGVKLRDTVTLSHLFYADDAVFVGQWSQRNISTLTHVLKCFHKASGLQINMCKSKILGIHVNNDNISRAAEDLGCQGYRVRDRLSQIDDEVCRVEEDFKSCCKWSWILCLSFLCSLVQSSSRVIKAIHGMDGSIGDIRIGNSKSCWSSIINEINVLSSKGIKLMNYLRITLGNGVSTRLWDEPWHVEGILKDRFPRIYALENCKSVTVGDKLAHQTLSHSFRRLPRGGIENAQFAEFSVLLQQVVLAQGSDRWTWTANGSGQFSVASVRKIIDNKLCSGGENSTRWIRCVPNKINIHAWKVMTESLATRFDISRRGIVIDSILCGNCDIGVETTSHLFFTCDMATSVRRLINRWWEVPDMEIDSYATWKGWIVTIRMASKTKLMFEGVYYVMWWLLWWYRNKKIFEGKSLIKAMFLDDVISKSFYWCRARCKASFSWTDWLKNPHLISL